MSVQDTQVHRCTFILLSLCVWIQLIAVEVTKQSLCVVQVVIPLLHFALGLGSSSSSAASSRGAFKTLPLSTAAATRQQGRCWYFLVKCCITLTTLHCVPLTEYLAYPEM